MTNPARFPSGDQVISLHRSFGASTTIDRVLSAFGPTESRSHQSLAQPTRRTWATWPAPGDTLDLTRYSFGPLPHPGSSAIAAAQAAAFSRVRDWGFA